MNDASRRRLGLAGWQRAALVILAVLNLWSCWLFYGEHPLWALLHGTMSALLFTLLVITWPVK